MDKPAPIFVQGKDLTHYVGLSLSYVYKLMKKGQFPHPVSISEKRVAWRYSDLVAWSNNPTGQEPHPT